MLADGEGHPEAEFVDPLVGPCEVLELGDLDVQVLDAGADGVDTQRRGGGDGDGVVAFVDPQEADLEFDAADGLVDVVGEAGVEEGAHPAPAACPS